jgi:hypothetical protein
MNKKNYESSLGDEDVLLFKIGDATAYSRVFKQLLDEAKAITPNGRDIAKMMIQNADVDFTPDYPVKRVIVGTDPVKLKALEDRQIGEPTWTSRMDLGKALNIPPNDQRGMLGGCSKREPMFHAAQDSQRAPQYQAKFRRVRLGLYQTGEGSVGAC